MVVHPASDRVPRARPYSGTETGTHRRVRLRGSNPVPPAFPCRSAPLGGIPPGTAVPGRSALQPRWREGCRPRALTGLASAPFRSPLLGGSRVDFFSSGYLDVSVPRVVPPPPMCSGAGRQACAWRVLPFGDPRIDGRVPLPADYRGLPRPSSASCAKASAVRPVYLARAPGAGPVAIPCISDSHQVSGVACRGAPEGPLDQMLPTKNYEPKN